MAIVLKSDSTSEKTPVARSVSGLAGFNLNDLADEGRHRLEECRAQIRQMLDEATKQGESIRKQAEQRGYEEGIRRAEVDADTKLKQEAESRAKDGLKVISQAVEHLYRTHEGWMQQYAETLSGIAIAAAQRIVRRELAQHPQLLVTWAQEALKSTRSATSLTLAVHPETLAELGDALDQLLASPDFPEQTHVEPDESLEPSDVVVRQVGGDIHAGLQAQLTRLEELLS